MNYCPNYLVNVHIFVSDQENTSLYFYASKVFFSISNQWLEFSGPRCPKLFISSHFKAKLGQFSFRILTIGYMIVLCQGVYLLIKPASLITFSCIAQGMPLNVMFSLPLLLIFSVKHVHRVVMLGN